MPGVAVLIKIRAAAATADWAPVVPRTVIVPLQAVFTTALRLSGTATAAIPARESADATD